MDGVSGWAEVAVAYSKEHTGWGSENLAFTDFNPNALWDLKVTCLLKRKVSFFICLMGHNSPCSPLSGDQKDPWAARAPVPWSLQPY